MLDEIKFVHPKDMQDGKVAVTARTSRRTSPTCPACTSRSITTSARRCASATSRPTTSSTQGRERRARRLRPLRRQGQRFGDAIQEDMMAAVDKADAAQFSREEILDPKGWVLLNYLMDPRTGLGRFREFRISNYQLMMELIDACLNQAHRRDPRPARRQGARGPLRRARRPRRSGADQALQQGPQATWSCSTCASEETIWPTNRFMLYALFPQCNISIHADVGPQEAEHVSSPRASRSSIARARGRTSASSCSRTAAVATQRPAPVRSRTTRPTRSSAASSTRSTRQADPRFATTPVRSGGGPADPSGLRVTRIGPRRMSVRCLSSAHAGRQNEGARTVLPGRT
jgi:hypothetical protein